MVLQVCGRWCGWVPHPRLHVAFQALLVPFAGCAAPHVVATCVEHPAVLNVLSMLEKTYAVQVCAHAYVCVASRVVALRRSCL